MPDYTVSGDVDSMLRSANDAAIRSAIGVGTTDAPTFLAVNFDANTQLTGSGGFLNYKSYGTTALNMGGTGLTLGTSGSNTASITLSNAAGVGAVITTDSPGILAQRNGVNAQAFRVYNSTDATPATNFDRASFGFTSNVLRIGTENGGTYTTARPIEFVMGGVVRMSIANDGSTSVQSGSVSAPSFKIGFASTEGWFSPASGQFTWAASGAGKFNFVIDQFRLAGTATIRAGAGSNVVGITTDVGFGWSSTGTWEINSGTAGAFRDLRLRNVIQSPGLGTTVTPASNGDLIFETTSNTSVTLKLKGSDGTVRSVALTLA